MKPFFISGVFLFAVSVAWAQTPTSGAVFEQRTQSSGTFLVIGGKSFGPYEQTNPVYSSSGSEAVFLVEKNEKISVIAQGKEWAPLPAGFEDDELRVSDDGKVWSLSAESDDQGLLMVNGKVYGPYLSVDSVRFAETGGLWVAAVETSEDVWTVLYNGQPQGKFTYVEAYWAFPDGKSWGFAASREDDSVVMLSGKLHEGVSSTSFFSMDPRAPHWAYSYAEDEIENIVVDGQAYQGYENFNGWRISPSGLHWGFSATKTSDSSDVVVIDGKAYPGQDLETESVGTKEWFTWTLREANKNTYKILRLP